MRELPLAKQGSAEVPTPLDPLGQSSRSLGGAGGVLGTGGGVGAGAAALGLVAAGGFASSSQPSWSVRNGKVNSSVDSFMGGGTGGEASLTKPVRATARNRGSAADELELARPIVSSRREIFVVPAIRNEPLRVAWLK